MFTIIHAYIHTYILTHNLSSPFGTLPCFHLLCRKEMLRAKQVGQVLRALVDFASKHAVFEVGNPLRCFFVHLKPRFVIFLTQRNLRGIDFWIQLYISYC